jgi:hypothetical protein
MESVINQMYPAVPSVETNNHNLKLIHESRVSYMLDKQTEIKKQLKHYTKIGKRWGRLDVGIKVTGLAIATSTVVGGAIAACLVAPGAVLVVGTLTASQLSTLVITSLTAAETIVTGGLVIGLTSKKKAFYREKCSVIQSFLDRMYVYIEKVRDDHLISIDELDGFKKLIDEYNTTMNSIKVEAFDFDKLNRQIKKEAGLVVKNQLVTEQVSQLKSQFAAANGPNHIKM